MKRVALIGGGFSGSIAAINLARLSPVPLEIYIVEKHQDKCRGIAYSTRNASHLLNVAARNMSALADQPNHFVEWLATRADYMDEPIAAVRERFIPRRVYGEYLHNLFQSYSTVLSEKSGMRFELINDEAQDVVIENETATVKLKNGRLIKADKVILAMGNQTPAAFRLKGLNPESRKYIGNPWLGWEKKLPAKDKDLLIIGTGLTMVDTFLSLKDIGWQGKIYAVSRNGLLPLSHFKGFEYPDVLNDDTARSDFRTLFSIFKKRYREAKAQGVNYAILVDKLRPYTQRIWQNFTLREKKQFNRHLRTRWNVVRHRIAPEIHQQLSNAIDQGKLEVLSGRLRACEESSEAMTITVDAKTGPRTLKVGAVINCTGPKESYLPSDSELLNHLHERGVIEPDEMNMGIKVAPNFAALDRAGRVSTIIFGMGSIMKGTFWETVAVPELRSQAFRLAETIRTQFAGATVEKSPIAEVVEDVMEYSI